jgi:nicotinamidase-related amidase
LLRAETRPVGLLPDAVAGLAGTPKVKHLVLAGVAGDQCVLTTAMDAHMRDFELWIPSDTTASITPKRNQRALDYISEVLGGSVAPMLAR